MGLMDWMDVARGVVKSVQRVQDQVGPLERMAIQAMGSPSSKNLDDNLLTYLLALAAFDSYTLSGNCRGSLTLMITQFQNLNGSNMQNKLQFGIYEISEGRYSGKKILAYRGTDVTGLVTLLQDVSLALPSLSYLGQPIREAISCAVEDALKQKPDFICGHSLGGVIAECVCSETGIPGASFNAPGPWSILPIHNLLTGDKYDGVKFEVHLTRNDPVSLFGGFLGPECTHVGRPIWHSGFGSESDNVIANHKMNLMLSELEKGR
ncbi:hypothetical protein ACHWQZ_G015231 [Mnemiopsis leidyi]